jgi:hypothetical protein
MSKSVNFLIKTVIFLLVLAPFFLAYLVVYKLGINPDTEALKLVLVYLTSLTILEILPLALIVYLYGDFDHMNFDVGSSDTGAEIIIIGGAFLLLIGKKISTLIVGKEYFKKSKGSLIRSIFSGVLISLFSYIVFITLIFVGSFIYSKYKS